MNIVYGYCMTKRDFLKRIGKNIQKARKAKGYTQESFAEKTNLSWSYISKVESGILNMSCAKIYDFAVYLDVPLEELLSLK